MNRFVTIGFGIFLAHALFAADAAAVRQKALLDFNWTFHLGDAPDAGSIFDYPEVADLAKTHLDELGREGDLATLADPDLGGKVSFVQPDFNDRDWRPLDLPHDWAVELSFDPNADRSHGFKAIGKGFATNNIGWYRRQFDLPADDKGKTLWLDFDGIYRNAVVWLNGHCLGRHLDGYSSFRYDISRYANYGGKNTLVVRVDASRFEGWFYEGAGIYRHVWLEKAAPVHIAPDGVFVWSTFSNNVPEGPAMVHVQLQLTNAGMIPGRADVTFDVIDPSGKPVASVQPKNGVEGTWSAWKDQFPGTPIIISTPRLWSPESPQLYKLITTVRFDSKPVDRQVTEFGIRTIAFDAEKGFLLNGKPYAIHGTCNHQDHAGVGAALPDALQYFRIKKLKEMGSNAYRTSHNPPTPELLEACDRLGMLVMDENRRMDTNDFELNELREFVRRDRNHPSVFIWSLGNEENYLQGTRTNTGFTTDMAHDLAAQIVTAMQNLVHEEDPTRSCTVAMNGGWGYGISGVIDVQGFNYRTANIDGFHEKYPTQPTIGTEVASTRVTRGIYTDDKERGYVASYATNGIARPWDWWSYYAVHPFTSGGFVWTGFDYRGEPTPYKWPCINSHFGIMDMCGFPKDIYYYYQSWWQDKPVLHILPHWNWPGREGQNVPVRVFSNCKEVELFLNGKSLGRQTMRTNWFLDWAVDYQRGMLSAKGYNGTNVTVADMPMTGAPEAIELSPDRSTVNADGEDVSVIKVLVVDAKGRVVPTADNLIHFDISGPGHIIGVGNGDPSSHEPDKADQRQAFCGYAEVIVQTKRDSGTIRLTATADGLKKATAKISSESVPLRPAIP